MHTYTFILLQYFIPQIFNYNYLTSRECIIISVIIHFFGLIVCWNLSVFTHLPVSGSSLSLGSSAICLIHFAHFKLITCDAQKQGPTLPHVYSASRLSAEVLDTEIAIRMQDRPHSRSLNLVSLPISHIGNWLFPWISGVGRGKKKRSAGPFSHPSFLFPRDRRYLYHGR